MDASGPFRESPPPSTVRARSVERDTDPSLPSSLALVRGRVVSQISSEKLHAQGRSASQPHLPNPNSLLSPPRQNSLPRPRVVPPSNPRTSSSITLRPADANYKDKDKLSQTTCPVCGSEYKTVYGMRQHYQSHFSPTHRCTVDGCGSAFHHKYLLTRHERIHFGNQSFPCPVEACRKVFSRKDNLTVHLHRVHMPGVHIPDPSHHRTSQHARGGRTSDFTVAEFPQLANFMTQEGEPPTAAEALEVAKALLRSAKDTTRIATLRKMHGFAKQLGITLSKRPGARRKIRYRPVEEAHLGPDRQPYFDGSLSMSEEEDAHARARDTSMAQLAVPLPTSPPSGSIPALSSPDAMSGKLKLEPSVSTSSTAANAKFCDDALRSKGERIDRPKDEKIDRTGDTPEPMDLVDRERENISTSHLSPQSSFAKLSSWVSSSSVNGGSTSSPPAPASDLSPRSPLAQKSSLTQGVDCAPVNGLPASLKRPLTPPSCSTDSFRSTSSPRTTHLSSASVSSEGLSSAGSHGLSSVGSNGLSSSSTSIVGSHGLSSVGSNGLSSSSTSSVGSYGLSSVGSYGLSSIGNHGLSSSSKSSVGSRGLSSVSVSGSSEEPPRKRPKLKFTGAVTDSPDSSSAAKAKVERTKVVKKRKIHATNGDHPAVPLKVKKSRLNGANSHTPASSAGAARHPKAKSEASTSSRRSRSKLSKKSANHPKFKDIRKAPTFYPTLEEFATPMEYIRKIRPEAEKYGICKIVSPKGHKRPNARENLKENEHMEFPTKSQEVNQLGKGQGFDAGIDYTLKEYERMAEVRCEDYKSGHIIDDSEWTKEFIEKEFFRLVGQGSAAEDFEAEYGNDIHTDVYGSGFDKNTDGNKTLHPFNLNRLPLHRDGVLRYLGEKVPGVSCPWLYVGMVFSAFCWHNEDNFLYSVSYHHFGHPKAWYGVPGKAATDLERCVKQLKPEVFKDQPDLMLKLITMVSPLDLMINGVPICRLVQRPGDYVVTFPRAYHAGFNLGFNCCEAVNFADAHWFKFGRKSSEKYRNYGRFSAFSHEKLLLSTIAYSSPLRDTKKLRSAVERLIDEEIWIRGALVEKGIKKTEAIMDRDFHKNMIAHLDRTDTYCTGFKHENNRFCATQPGGDASARGSDDHPSKASSSSTSASSSSEITQESLLVGGRFGEHVPAESVDCYFCKHTCFLGFVRCSKCRQMVMPEDDSDVESDSDSDSESDSESGDKTKRPPKAKRKRKPRSKEPRERSVCLQHCRELCDCALRHRVMHLRHTVPELERFLKFLKQQPKE